MIKERKEKIEKKGYSYALDFGYFILHKLSLTGAEECPITVAWQYEKIIEYGGARAKLYTDNYYFWRGIERGYNLILYILKKHKFNIQETIQEIGGLL